MILLLESLAIECIMKICVMSKLLPQVVTKR